MNELQQLLYELMTLSVMKRLIGQDTSDLDVIIEKYKHLLKENRHEV